MLNVEKEILKSWCILIVDDSPEDRIEIRRMLLKGSDRRLNFIEAGTADAGIQAALGAALPPDCMVVDYNLPDMDAPEVLAALVGPYGMPICPVLVITGGTNREHGRRALRAGAQDYFGKDWSNPQALNRAVENACEIWAMARDLRQRENALRQVADRETFLNVFRNATSDLREESVVRHVASQLLGEYLKVNRVLYGEMAGEETVWVEQNYVSGVLKIEGSHKLSEYGPQLQATLMAGKNIVMYDVRVDCAYSESEKATYAQMDICANLTIPIMKGGRLVAVLGVHQKTPREWTPEDQLIAREIAERTWAAMEHVRAEQSLLAKEIQLSQMIQIMPSFSAVLVGPAFVFQMANQAYFDVTGRGSEIIGKTVLEAFPEVADQPFPALLEKVYRTGQPFEAKSMVVRLPRGLDGSLTDIFVDLAYLPLLEADGKVSSIFVHGVDRTAEVRVTQELAWREREMRSLTENIPDGLTRFDRQLHFVFVNSVFENIAGRPTSEILGKTIHELSLPEQVCNEWETAIHRVLDHEVPESVDFSFPTVQGLRHFSCRLVPEFNEFGVIETVLGVTHDITNKKLLDLILQNKNIELESAIAIAEKANRAKSDFLSSMSHELRTPLNAILGFGQLMESGLPVLTPPQKRNIDQILKAGWYLLELINEILDLALVESGRLLLSQELVSLSQLVVECQDMVEPQAQKRGINIVFAQIDTALCVWSDLTRLKQIFVNLLSNAIKYNRVGGSVFVDFTLLPAQSVRISVRDTGLGLTPEQLDQLFQPFNRLGRETGTEEGTGIGLVVTKRLVELMGGRIGVESTVAEGSVFWFELELATQPHITARDNDSVALVRPPTPVDTRKYTLLCVEDNAANLELVKQLLERRTDWALLSAPDATLGIDLARSNLPDAILMDINMPGISGIDAMQILRADPLTAHIPIIAVSAIASSADIEKGIKAGFFSYVTKPIRVDKFMESINAALAFSQALAKRKAQEA